MKIINPERQNETGSTTTSADPNFPLANLFDSHPRNWYRPIATNWAKPRLKIDAGSSALACFSTNADDVICTVTVDGDEQTVDNAAATNDGGGLVGIPCTGHGYSSGDQILLHGTTNYDGVYTLDASTTINSMVITATYAAETFAGTETVAEVQATETFDLRVIDSYGKLIIDDPEVYRQCWMDYPYQSAACTATIEMAAVSGTILKVGRFVAGVGLSLPDPMYGIQESRRDYSVRKELNNGALYVRKRNIVRVFEGEVLLSRTTRASDFYYFFDVLDQAGPNPVAFLLADDIDDKVWTVYGRFDSPMKGRHSYKRHAVVSFSIEEAI